MDGANSTWRWEIVAFVFMPEHIHLLAIPLEPDPDIGASLHAIKRPFSREIHGIVEPHNSKLLAILIVRDRPGHRSFRLWQEGLGYDRNLWTAKAIWAAIDYIHENPVRRGLCQRAEQWKWSSARWYLGDPPRQQDPDLPILHGQPVGALES